jgi:7-keto-8-aminopelargonate synthetase-like enzyme
MSFQVEQKENFGRVLPHSTGVLSSDINIWRATFGKILCYHGGGGAVSGKGVCISILRPTRQAYVATHIWVPAQYLL